MTPNKSSSTAILVAVCLAALVMPLSFSGGAVATPAIGRDLGGSAVALTWITNAFMLSFGSLLMGAGALADQLGRKQVFIAGLGIFVAGSAALGFAPTVLAVDLLRAVQGVGAAAALSGGTAALAQEFEGAARMRAFSLLGTTFGVGLAFGPIAAGMLIAGFGWRAIFMAPAILGAMALLCGLARMRESRAPEAAGVDWAGAVSFTLALSLLTFAVIQAPASGWGSGLVVGLLVGAVVVTAFFVVVETRSARPMLDLTLFRYPLFLGVQLLPIATCCCFVVLLVLLPLRFIGIEGRSETETGLLMLAISAPMLAVPSVAARLTRWFSAGAISSAGLVVASAALVWLGLAAPGSGLSPVPAMLLIGLGTGLPWGLMDGLSVSLVPKERAGMATGIFSTTRVAGEGIALAIVGAVLAGLLQARLGHPEAGDVAQRLAAGDLAQAAGASPALGRAGMVAAYADAFAALVDGLAVLTLACAAAIFALLGRPRDAGVSEAGVAGGN